MPPSSPSPFRPSDSLADRLQPVVSGESPASPTTARPRRSAWESWPAKILRWLVFLPLGLFLVYLLEFGLLFLNLWLFGDSLKELLVIGIFLGGLGFVLPIACALTYGAVLLATRMVCPGPRVGAVLFAIAYLFLAGSGLLALPEADLPLAPVLVVLGTKLVLGITVLVGVVHAYRDLA